jgi:hypothetical protein
MNLEIHKPDLLQRVNAQLERRQLQDVDELIEQALDALDENPPHRNPLPWLLKT